MLLLVVLLVLVCWGSVVVLMVVDGGALGIGGVCTVGGAVCCWRLCGWW